MIGRHGHSHSHGHGHGHGCFGGHGHGDGAPRPASARRLLAFSKPEAGSITLGIFCLLISTGVNLGMPYSLGYIITRSGIDAGAIAGYVFLIFLAGSLFTLARGYLFQWSGERIVARMRRQLFASIMNQDMSFFDTHRTGDLLTRLSADITMIQTAANFNLPMMMRFFVQIAGGAVILFVISWKLTLVVLSPLPVLAVIAVVYSRYARGLTVRVQTALAATTSSAEQAIGGIRFVRAYGKEDAEINSYNGKVDESLALGKKAAVASGVFQSSVEFASYVCIILTIWYGSVLIASGEVTTAFLLSYILYTIYVAHASGALSNNWGEFMRAVGAAQRIFEIIDRKPAFNITGGKTITNMKGRILFNEVFFKYPSRPDVTVLDNVSLKLEPGKLVALVGASGSGKSTIASLILRMYDIDLGSLTIDGVNIKELDPRWLRGMIGYVQQDPVIFATTIRDNIAYGREDSTQNEIERAAKRAHIHDFIMSLPDGYKTMAGERGHRFSGGQKQRLAIARAILKDPPIVVLDEATSALDVESEHEVQRALVEVLKNRTGLVIAHRLSTIRSADVVIAMEKGKIVETGTHAELIKRNGPYARLVRRQEEQQGELMEAQIRISAPELRPDPNSDSGDASHSEPHSGPPSHRSHHSNSSGDGYPTRAPPSQGGRFPAASISSATLGGSSQPQLNPRVRAPAPIKPVQLAKPISRSGMYSYSSDMDAEHRV